MFRYLLDVDASAEDVGGDEDLLQALSVPVQHLTTFSFHSIVRRMYFSHVSDPHQGGRQRNGI